MMEEETNEQTIRVVLVEPGKYAREAEIGTSLSELQEVCGGWIQTYYPFEETVCIVCNDEGKLIGMPLNRGIKDSETGELIEIIAGPFFICDCSTENFGSLSKEQVECYIEQFKSRNDSIKLMIKSSLFLFIQERKRWKDNLRIRRQGSGVFSLTSIAFGYPKASCWGSPRPLCERK